MVAKGLVHMSSYCLSQTESIFTKYRLVVKASASRATRPRSDFLLHLEFSGSSHASGLKIDTPMATLQAPGVIGSALGLVGPL